MNSITEKIWIGNYVDASDAAALANAGIRSILCLDGCMADRRTNDLRRFRQRQPDDRAEFLAGLDSSDSGSVLQVVSCYLPGADTFSLIWSAVPGKTYRVQSKQAAPQAIILVLSEFLSFFHLAAAMVILVLGVVLAFYLMVRL